MRRAPSKYHAVPTELDGIRFASKKEAKRYAELKLLEKAGEITGLILQPRYALTVTGNGVGNEPPGFVAQLGSYVADFTYFDIRARRVVVEDVKSPPTKTPLWRWKVKHLRAQYGIEVVTT